MRKNIKFNDIDFTSYFTPTGYQVSYKKIKGPNEGYMLDGSFTDDVLAVKSVITLTCMPLSEEQLTTLLQQLYSDVLNVYFFDPKIGDYRTCEMAFDPPVVRNRGRGTNEVEYWTGAILVMTEK